MKFGQLTAVVITFCIIITGCSSTGVMAGQKKEVTAYSQVIVKLKEMPSLDITSDTGNLEVYSWEKNEVKFEITKKVRGIGDKASLEEKLKDFSIKINEQNGKVFFNSVYRGSIKNPIDRSVDLKIFVPKKIRAVNCKMDLGTLKFLDDIRCTLDMDVNMVNINIKYFEGKINLRGDMSSLVVENGKIIGDSSVKVNFGNIDIKAAFSENQKYSFETETGNIDFRLPATSIVSFESIGTIGINDFPENKYSTKIRVSSGMGKINLQKT